MGFILLLLTIIGLIAVLNLTDGVASAVIGTIVSTIIAAIIMCFVWGISYGNYVYLKRTPVVLQQYEKALDYYYTMSKPMLTDDHDRVIGELTDRKYDEYQKYLHHRIEEYEEKIVEYNKVLVGKQVLKKNWFWSWCIIGPDADMQTIEM
jgi:hypothetical protein